MKYTLFQYILKCGDINKYWILVRPDGTNVLCDERASVVYIAAEAPDYNSHVNMDDFQRVNSLTGYM